MNKRKTFLVSTLALVQSLCSSFSTAQGLEEIVVTAQKRKENVQDVPIAISAFSADSLGERVVGGVAGLSNLSPNVTLDAGTPFSGSSSTLSAYIRGIGQNDFAANVDPGVGVYVDGVYLARTVGANFDLADVERVEILKGPQGTLFGRNTIGGAISIVTRDPGKEFELDGSVTLGDYNRRDVDITADIPISNSLSSTFTLSSRNRDGYLDRKPFPASEGFINDSDASFRSNGLSRGSEEGEQSSWTVRTKLKWDINDRATLRFSGDYLEENSTATANSLLATTESQEYIFAVTPDRAVVTPFGPSALYDSDSGLAPNGFNLAGLYNFCISSTAAEIAGRNATALCGSRGTPLNPNQQIGGIASANVDADPTNDRLPFDSRYITTDIDKSFATGISFSTLKNWGLSGAMDFDITDWLSLKSITSYRDLSWGSGLDADGSPIRALEYSFSLEQSQFSQELQFIGSAFDEGLNYVFGVYYFEEESFLNDFVTFDQGLLQIYGPNELETQNYAVFGQMDYVINSWLSVTLGGRFTDEDKSFVGGQSDLNGFNYKLFNCPVFGEPCTTGLGFPNSSEPLRYYVKEKQKKSFTNFSPKIGFQVHPKDSMMIYASYSEGFKSGGWTTRLSNPLPFASDFDEEVATTYEVGIKSRFMDNKVQINAATFVSNFEDIQLNFQQGVSPTIQNAGDARIKGVELEAVFSPNHSFSVNSSVGYIDSYYTSVEPEAIVPANLLQAGTFVGAPLPKTPEWTFNISPRFEVSAFDGGSIVFLADYTYTSGSWNDTERALVLKRPSTDSVNVSIAYGSADEKWKVTIGGTNLTDDRYLSSGGNQTAAGLLFGTYNRPKEWYVKLDFNL